MEDRKRRQRRELIHGSGAPASLAEVLRRGRSAPPGRPRGWRELDRRERAAIVWVYALIVGALAVVLVLALA